MRVYTFLDEYGKVIEEVMAENHDIALARCADSRIEFFTDFYSTAV